LEALFLTVFLIKTVKNIKETALPSPVLFFNSKNNFIFAIKSVNTLFYRVFAFISPKALSDDRAFGSHLSFSQREQRKRLFYSVPARTHGGHGWRHSRAVGTLRGEAAPAAVWDVVRRGWGTRKTARTAHSRDRRAPSGPL
jgi:hypothetical protein